jgi:hypothetical protein
MESFQKQEQGKQYYQISIKIFTNHAISMILTLADIFHTPQLTWRSMGK